MCIPQWPTVLRRQRKLRQRAPAMSRWPIRVGAGSPHEFSSPRPMTELRRLLSAMSNARPIRCMAPASELFVLNRLGP